MSVRLYGERDIRGAAGNLAGLSFSSEENIPRYLLQQATFPGSSNLPDAVGNMGGLANAQFYEGPQLGQAVPHGSPQRMQPREYLDQNMPAYPPGYGPPSKQPQPQSPEPFNPTQLELPLAMRGLQVPPGFQAKYVS